MNNFKISTQLTVLIGVLCAVVVTVGSLGLFGTYRSNEALRSVYEDQTVPAAQMGQIGEMTLHSRLAVTVALLTPTPAIIEKRTAQMASFKTQTDKLWADYLATHLTPEELQLAKRFSEDRERLWKEALLPAAAALRANDVASAQALAVDKLSPLYNAMQASLDPLVRLQVDEAQKAYAAASARYLVIRNASAAAMMAGVALACLLGALMVRSIGRQLGAEPVEAAELVQCFVLFTT